jgi:hypothetical protein
MIIQLFCNSKALIYGEDNKRIYCDEEGTLKIGDTEINVKAKEECVLPLLFFGASADYKAQYVTPNGIYDLGKVAVRSGRIKPAPSEKVEMMELHLRSDNADEERRKMKADIEKLKHIFDTNSLNFIIKGED